ncbi:MAG: beta-N-acetylhexosaminidase [Burkholderiaceae bacterium]|jgi:beta-N-acetylhexosaminidase|nr:beta-N-acetylhexosaminidase [Burkholderiaceae bacterium]MDP4968122.1 beta-N-acetylhexosaminidase [Burkholderiaceae bacterium]
MTQHAPLIIDVATDRLTAQDVVRLSHPLVGGVILFGRNWTDRETLLALCQSIKAVRSDLLICVDHEGGRVQRFRRDGFTHIPAMRALGERWLSGKADDAHPATHALHAMNAATACGYVMGAELRACGVDFTFAPILDLDYGHSAVIGDRAFSRDPGVTAALAKSVMQGLLQAGMGNCGKHFPGHGFVAADSHTDIPIDRRALKAILSDDALPYAWLNGSLTSVMPAHVVYPRVDKRPAGFSSRWLQDILRGRLGFQGAVFSDDLSMAGARTIEGLEVTPTAAAVLALNAGCDLVLLCNQCVVDAGAPIDDLLSGLTQALLQNEWADNDASEDRRRRLLPVGDALGWDDLMVDPVYMHAMSLLP